MGPFRGPYRGSPLRDPCWWAVTTEVAAHWEEVLMGPFRGGTHNLNSNSRKSIQNGTNHIIPKKKKNSQQKRMKRFVQMPNSHFINKKRKRNERPVMKGSNTN